MTISGEQADTASTARTGVRFFIVSVCAFLGDITLALLLREALGLSVTFAAAISFVAMWIASYFGHEFWTFRGAQSRVSVGRFTRNLVSNAIALSVRLAIIFTLESIHDPQTRLLAAFYLLTGAGFSFTVNFLLNRFWVFARK